MSIRDGCQCAQNPTRLCLPPVILAWTPTSKNEEHNALDNHRGEKTRAWVGGLGHNDTPTIMRSHALQHRGGTSLDARLSTASMRHTQP
eukprot:3370132-Amphidinium_carterae.1